MNLRLLRPRRSKGAQGFSLFEVIVAMFIMLVGLLGIIAVFGAGTNARLLAQELVVSQELANMWADWMRFRLNESKAAGGSLGVLHLSDLAAGKKGDFNADSGDFHLGSGSLVDLPTFQSNVYSGYGWEITDAKDYTPVWAEEADPTKTHPWDQRRDGSSVIPSTMGTGPQALKQVQLTISRGARLYRFNYIFSGVGLKYDKLNP